MRISPGVLHLLPRYWHIWSVSLYAVLKTSDCTLKCTLRRYSPVIPTTLEMTQKSCLLQKFKISIHPMAGNQNSHLGGWYFTGFSTSVKWKLPPFEMEGWQAFVSGPPKFKVISQELAYTPWHSHHKNPSVIKQLLSKLSLEVLKTSGSPNMLPMKVTRATD